MDGLQPQSAAFVAGRGCLPVPLPAGVAAEVPNQIVVFSLQGRKYAVDIRQVREIIGYVRPVVPPQMPHYGHGVINLRGGAVPVLDLEVMCGRPCTPVQPRTCIVILEVAGDHGPQVMGMLVDAVNAVRDLEGAELRAPPHFGSGQPGRLVCGMVQAGGDFLMLLDVSRGLIDP